MRDVALEIFRRRGLKGFYRGFFPTAMRETGFGAYFGVYEATLMYFSSPSEPLPHSPQDRSPLLSEAAQPQSHTKPRSHSYPVLLLAGGLAGAMSWIVTFPFDVIKTRVQSTLSPGSDNPYRNTLSTIVHSYRQEGLRVFFHGLTPTLIR